ncbi:MAG: excinuclease ABC subunit UvrA [Nitrospira sp.]|nr:excinuclease ABC subunit UvrA [bacterium]MBL7049430.1 excinuclease ABC subunit UvrA [Nitrospira sp.]
MLRPAMLNTIDIKGARVHNLKNISLRIPRDKLVVITGPSGSGKSSLAFDTIYAEGQRRYVESLSAYARQFLVQMQKPDVDSIEGLSPSIAIDQKSSARTYRSTVGTVTEIYDYLRVAYTRIGILSCYKCGNSIATQRSQQIIENVLALPEGTRIQILSPIVSGRKGEYKKELEEARRKGIIRARIDGEMTDITGEVKLNKHKRHNIDIVIDRLIIKPGIEKHVTQAITHATGFSSAVTVNIINEDRDLYFSTLMACHHCGTSYPEISPRFFSFNSPHGYCPGCRGLGFSNVDEEGESGDRLKKCPECSGLRLRKEALSVRLGGLNIGELSAMPIGGAIEFLKNLKLTAAEKTIASKILKEVRERLGFLKSVGLDYLTLDRAGATLSNGEAQRVKLATQVGSSLTGVLYIFDEPSIGLHPRDHEKLLDSLCQLKTMGNSVLIVEHDEDTMLRADHIVDMGPEAGVRGGYVVSSGTLAHIKRDKSSLTGSFLRGSRSIPIPLIRRNPKEFIEIKGARSYNLKNIDVKIPLGTFACVTGVSGSGKSSLIIDILYKALSKKLHAAGAVPGRHLNIEGAEKIDKIIDIDQSPLGRSPRSNPATYNGIFTLIRDLFGQLPGARVRGYKPGRFSFNVKGGRCETCSGDGLVKISMHFLPDLYIPCEICRGSRYNRETLEIRYRDKNISDVLNMTVRQAMDFFSAIPRILHRLNVLDKVGLGYVQLGQSATTLSGGEAQRVKLARELSRPATGNTLYILDEPTTGLHFVDIQKLLEVLNELVEAGNSVLVIEHNLDVIKSADYIIDIGPESGERGGKVIAQGTPEKIARSTKSHTGRFLKPKLKEKQQA